MLYMDLMRGMQELLYLFFMVKKPHPEHAQSTLRHPEVHTFAWKMSICIARMGDNNMSGARVSTKGSKFTGVTLDKSALYVYFGYL